MKAAAFLVLFVAIMWCAVIALKKPAHGQDSEYLKQILRLQTTEFCATVGKPPPALAEAINGAVKQDPATWLPIVLWWNRIAEKYEKAKCGDA